MAKFKPVRAKSKTPQVKAGLPCVIIVLLGMILILVLLFLVMKYAA